MSPELTAAIARAQALQARSLGYRDAGTRYDPSDVDDFDHLRAMDGLSQRDDDEMQAFARGALILTARLRSEGALEPGDARANRRLPDGCAMSGAIFRYRPELRPDLVRPESSGQTPGEIEVIHYHLRKTKVGVCEWCGTVGRTDISYMRHPWPYTRDRRDYVELCQSCHTTLDDCLLGGAPRLRAARAQTHCKRGHELNEENTYIRTSGNGIRQCRVCHREEQRAYREQNREKDRVYQRAYYERNRDKINAQQRERARKARQA